ncbi:MAG TPA: hypothetical protein VGI45_22675 [Terracidiphilus sp.]|jgi:hypothetical protein
MVTAAVPLAVIVIDFDTDVPTATLPNASEVVLTVNADVVAFKCSATLFDEPLALAVKVAAWSLLTEATITVNGAVLPPDAIDTLAGTVTAPLLLVTATFTPPAGAAELNDTVHAVDPAPVNELVAQERPVTDDFDAGTFNCSETLFDEPFALAVNVAV